MMATALFIGTLISFGLMIISLTKWNQEKAELTQTIDFLNRNLNEENRSTFFPTQSFEFRDTLNPSTPRVIYDDLNMKNSSYRRAINDYERLKKSFTLITSIFAILGLTLAIVLIIQFPEFVQELLENDAS